MTGHTDDAAHGTSGSSSDIEFTFNSGESLDSDQFDRLRDAVVQAVEQEFSTDTHPVGQFHLKIDGHAKSDPHSKSTFAKHFDQ